MHPWSTVRLTALARTMARHAGHGFEDIADEDMATQRRSPYRKSGMNVDANVLERVQLAHVVALGTRV